MSAPVSGNRATNDEVLEQVDADLTPEVMRALDFLRDEGFAVAAFTPTELRGADPDRIEDAMVQMGWDAIGMDATEPLPDESEEVVPQETTLAKFAGIRAGNYSTMPTIDVPILPDVHVCKTCGELIVRVPDPTNVFGGRWEHKLLLNAPEHWVTTATRCRYCNSHDAKYRQHAWYDAVECDRCGGVAGYAIGD